LLYPTELQAHMTCFQQLRRAITYHDFHRRVHTSKAVMFSGSSRYSASMSLTPATTADIARFGEARPLPPGELPPMTDAMY
jgi:hypothetical protein